MEALDKNGSSIEVGSYASFQVGNGRSLGMVTEIRFRDDGDFVLVDGRQSPVRASRCEVVELTPFESAYSQLVAKRGRKLNVEAVREDAQELLSVLEEAQEPAGEPQEAGE